MARYAQTPRIVPDAIFVVFMLSWIASRCIYFPFYIIHSTLFESTVSQHPSCTSPPHAVVAMHHSSPHASMRCYITDQ